MTSSDDQMKITFVFFLSVLMSLSHDKSEKRLISGLPVCTL